MQDRRDFLKTGFSIAAAGLAGAAALTGARRSLAEEAPPETTSVRLGQYPASCLAPLYIVDDLLREEGFADIRFVPLSESLSASIARGEVDFGQDFSAPIIIPIDVGAPMIMLGGVHPGCIELFARESIRSVVDLRGKRVGVGGMDDAGYVLASIIAASVGLDPAKDINWVFGRSPAFLGSSMARPRQSPTTASTGPRVQAELFAAGEIDAFLTFPPWAQELRARNFGRVIFNSALDRPWSQYFCCMLIGASDFVRRNPIATKRVVRAMVRATDICADKPDWVAQRLVDRDFTARYDSTRQGLYDVPYRNWREYDPEDAVRFYALRLHELGMIKSSPDTIIAKGADWRFVKDVRKELGI
jgi:NitT/TauT family transport system substrate-binding protein